MSVGIRLRIARTGRQVHGTPLTCSLRHSRGVDVFFRVSRIRLAAHWLAAPTSTFDLSVVVRVVFTGLASRSHYRTGALPS
jgi:hypothetical protein